MRTVAASGSARGDRDNDDGAGTEPGTMTSLNAIKSGLGYDARTLERSREDVDQQQRGADVAAVMEEAAAAGMVSSEGGMATMAMMARGREIDLMELVEDISEVKDDIRSYERILSRTDPSDVEKVSDLSAWTDRWGHCSCAARKIRYQLRCCHACSRPVLSFFRPSRLNREVLER